MSFPADIRSRRDLVTNPAFADVHAVLDEMVRLETVILTNDAKGNNLEKVNYQAGVLEGIKRVQTRLGNYREDALSDFHKDSNAIPDGP
tara:strand:+ start:482 stop:748 length:267 start_codon:yes stop_codon:yes gene_type:complete